MANSKPAWWHNASIYQVLIQTFQDSNGDGIGDFEGVRRRLPYINKLSNAIWITPFYQSPKRDNGYDVADHRAIDPDYGTLASARSTIREAQAMGLKVVADQVMPHTSSQHPWFEESRQNRTNPKADWYVWADPVKGGGPPNNWLSVFGGSAWTFEPKRDQYYLHHFYDHQPKVNLANPKVAEAQLKVTEFLLGDLRVDGLRLDAYDYLFHNTALPDNPAMPLERRISLKPFGSQDHVHDMTQTAPTLELTRQLRKLAGPSIFLLGEFSSQPGANDRIRNLQNLDRLNGGYTLGDLARKPVTHNAITEAHGTLNGSTAWCFANHDTEGTVSRHATGYNVRLTSEREAGLPVARQLALIPAVLGGLSFVFQREELGLTDARLETHEKRDAAGRDGTRTPVPWTSQWPNAGFTIPGAKPYLRVPHEHLPYSVSTQEYDDGSHLNYCRAIHAMRQTDAFKHGEREILPTPAPILAVVIRHEGQQLPFIFNLSNETVHLSFGAIPASVTRDVPALQAVTTASGLTLPPRATIMPARFDPASSQPERTAPSSRFEPARLVL